MRCGPTPLFWIWKTHTEPINIRFPWLQSATGRPKPVGRPCRCHPPCARSNSHCPGGSGDLNVWNQIEIWMLSWLNPWEIHGKSILWWLIDNEKWWGRLNMTIGLPNTIPVVGCQETFAATHWRVKSFSTTPKSRRFTNDHGGLLAQQLDLAWQNLWFDLLTNFGHRKGRVLPRPTRWASQPCRSARLWLSDLPRWRCRDAGARLTWGYQSSVSGTFGGPCWYLYIYTHRSYTYV